MQGTEIYHQPFEIVVTVSPLPTIQPLPTTVPDSVPVVRTSPVVDKIAYPENTFNVSGTINIIDALLIAQYYVGLISEFPGC